MVVELGEEREKLDRNEEWEEVGNTAGSYRGECLLVDSLLAVPAVAGAGDNSGQLADSVCRDRPCEQIDAFYRITRQATLLVTAWHFVLQHMQNRFMIWTAQQSRMGSPWYSMHECVHAQDDSSRFPPCPLLVH